MNSQLFNSKRDDDDSSFSLSKDKAVVLQEARVFNESPIHPKKCRIVLSRIIYLLYNKAEVLGKKEATETFFSITKLFQNPDPSLRQMVYLVIKELSAYSDDVIMITSSVTKDMNARGDLIYKPNAIRALCKITDSSMIQGIERFIKQAIVDKNPAVSSAAMVSALHLFSSSKDVVRRWANEVQEAMTSRGITTQYHALGLLYQIRQHDRMAVIKMIQAFSKTLRSPFAYCMLIRYTAKIVAEESMSPLGVELWGMLEMWLNHKSEMVSFEAAKAICSLPNLSRHQLARPVACLQVYLSNHKTTVKFAAIRTLNKLAINYPEVVSTCNIDMEGLISDSNRSIATFAITTLLKTGNEDSVDRLMKQISGFMTEISDEFKVIVVDAVRSLCLKFPTKHSQMLTFLSACLRDEGGYEYKRAIVEAMFDIVHNIPESKESALSHLCEFIEDCEFTKLAVRILHLLGTYGPTASTNPSKYIRYIYNRVILENSTIRASAVAALARFAVVVESLRGRIKILLTRCLDDSDDEVRDRAAFYLQIIEDEVLRREFIENQSTYSWSNLESNLMAYLSNPTVHSKPFDIKAIPVVSKAQEIAEISRLKTLNSYNATGMANQAPAASLKKDTPVDTQSLYAKNFSDIPSLAALGTVFKSSKPIELTESETEYMVSCIKHIFPSHVVFQFCCKNTLNDSILEKINVEMKMTTSDEIENIREELSLSIDQLVFDIPGNAYVVFRRAESTFPTASFCNILKFIVKDCDPNTGETDEIGYEDEYLVEDVDLVIGDYIIPTYVSNFAKSWEDLGEANEVIETYELTAIKSIQAAVTTVLDLLGMLACENTGTSLQSTNHTLLLSGIFSGGIPALAKCRMVCSPTKGITMELSVRSADEMVSEKLANAIY